MKVRAQIILVGTDGPDEIIAQFGWAADAERMFRHFQQEFQSDTFKLKTNIQ